MTLDYDRERRGYLNRNRSLLFLFVVQGVKVGPTHACVEEAKNARGKKSANCILKLTQQQKPVILGHEYIIIKEGYFTLSPPLFVCSPVDSRTLPSEKIGASSSQKGGGGSIQAICVPFCLGFVCTYLDVLKLSVFEKIRVHSLLIQIFFTQNA